MKTTQQVYERPTGLARIPNWCAILIFLGGFVAILAGFSLSYWLFLKANDITQVVGGVGVFMISVMIATTLLTLPDWIMSKKRATWFPFLKPLRIIDIITVSTSHAADPSNDETLTKIVFEDNGTWMLSEPVGNLKVSDVVSGQSLASQSLVRNLTKVE